jgi:hypothetical protein
MDPCKGGVLASSKTEQATSTELGQLIGGYRLCARSEGKSKNTIDIVANSVGYFEGFLRSEGLLTDAGRAASDAAWSNPLFALYGVA